MSTPRPKPCLPPPHPTGQRGILLLEALIAILIFALGILGLVGLQTSAIRQATDAEYRAIAAFKANDLISRMWTSDRNPTTLQTNFASSSGALFSQWQTEVQASGLPGVSSANSSLPTVTFTTVAAGATGGVSSSRAVITIFWRVPSESTNHQYVVTAQMKP